MLLLAGAVGIRERHQPWLVDFDASETMADQPALATDVAELLVSIARIVGGERVLASVLAGLNNRRAVTGS